MHVELADRITPPPRSRAFLPARPSHVNVDRWPELELSLCTSSLEASQGSCSSVAPVATEGGTRETHLVEPSEEVRQVVTRFFQALRDGDEDAIVSRISRDPGFEQTRIGPDGAVA